MHARDLVYFSLSSGAYFGSRYLLRKASSLQLVQRAPLTEDARLREHFEANQLTCLSAVLKLVPTMKKTICDHLDVDSITAQLKTRQVK